MPQNWNFKSSPTDFFIKSATEMVLSRLGIIPESLIQKESTRRYFAESLAYYSGDILIAETGKISAAYWLNLISNRMFTIVTLNGILLLS